MICPRCSVAEVPDGTSECPLCGFLPSGSVLVERPVVDEILERVQEAVADQFHIRSALGLGEQSFVYLASEIGRDRLVALKVMPAAVMRDSDLVQRFERQAHLSASLQHAHVLPVLDHGVCRSFLWYAMEPARGKSLAAVLRDAGPMDLDASVRMLEQVASALDHAHRHGVVHGNLKPTNIFLDEKWVQVADFAILDAFRRSSGQAGDGGFMRQPEYLAPEQFVGRGVGPAADQYAFAIVAFQCLTGMLPFVGDSSDEVARMHATVAAPRLNELRKDIPVHVSKAVERALSKHPAERFPSILDCAAALTGGAAARPVRVLATPPRPSSASRVIVIEQPAQSRRWLRVALVGAGVAVGAGSMLLWQGANREAPAPIAAADFVRDSPPVEIAKPLPTTPAAPVPLRTEPPPPPAVRAQPRTVAAEPARLFVNATPWGLVYIDGTAMGNTPKADLRLTPGTHVVRVARDGFEPFQRQIQIGPGEVLRLTGIVLEPRRP